MKDYNIEEISTFEHRFWLQILGDHARFIKSDLAPKETELITLANYYIKIFDNLLTKARENLSEDELNKLTHQAYCNAVEIRGFKLNIINKHLTGNIDIDMTPTFLNHMVNEVEEYIRVLGCLLRNFYSPVHPIHYHLIWLLDGVGHAAGIVCSLDDVEKDYQGIGRSFHQKFLNLQIKAIEMSGYLRTHNQTFPSLDRLNEQANSVMKDFMEFLKDVEKLRIDKKLLGTIPPLITDHMYREECYYLTKLSKVSDIKIPKCDPTKPRLILPD